MGMIGPLAAFRKCALEMLRKATFLSALFHQQHDVGLPARGAAGEFSRELTGVGEG